MKLCPYCSGEMDNASVICQHCGRDWRSGVQVHPPPQTDPARPTSSWAEITSSENKVLWRFLVVVAVALFLSSCVWMLSSLSS